METQFLGGPLRTYRPTSPRVVTIRPRSLDSCQQYRHAGWTSDLAGAATRAALPSAAKTPCVAAPLLEYFLGALTGGSANGEHATISAVHNDGGCPDCCGDGRLAARSRNDGPARAVPNRTVGRRAAPGQHTVNAHGRAEVELPRQVFGNPFCKPAPPCDAPGERRAGGFSSDRLVQDREGSMINLNYEAALAPYLVRRGALKSAPLVLVDVGVSAGIHRIWEKFEDDLRVWGFDPLVREIERLNALGLPGHTYECAFVGSRPIALVTRPTTGGALRRATTSRGRARVRRGRWRFCTWT